jgi:ubiquinone/menaquinone biosynthesis C-methylase UbiE
MVARQLAQPTGVWGRVIALAMNRMNANMNAFAVRQLEPEPSDRILEVGFGGGVTLPALIEAGAFLAGVDRSADMVDRAKTRFSVFVQAGRAEFRTGSIDALPFPDGSFDKVCTVNTIYFWNSLDTGFRELRRVLAPGGCAVVGFLPKQHMDRMGMPSDIFTPRAPDDVLAAICRAGFIDAQVRRPEPTTPWNVVVATR